MILAVYSATECMLTGRVPSDCVCSASKTLDGTPQSESVARRQVLVLATTFAKMEVGRLDFESSASTSFTTRGVQSSGPRAVANPEIEKGWGSFSKGLPATRTKGEIHPGLDEAPWTNSGDYGSTRGLGRRWPCERPGMSASAGRSSTGPFPQGHQSCSQNIPIQLRQQCVSHQEPAETGVSA
jgi:hypothetical protein